MVCMAISKEDIKPLAWSAEDEPTFLKDDENKDGKSGNVAGFCVNRNLPYKAISGRIKADCNMRFGCCHNGGRFSPQIHFGVPCEGTFLEYEKIPQSNTERGMTLMKLELNFSDLCQLALVIIALIELFRDRKHKKK